MRMRQFLYSLIVGMFLLGGISVNTAQACPMCKNATETDDRRPQAYMYSILFMIAVPATVFTGFGVSFYRLSKQMPQSEELLELLKDEHEEE